MAEDPRTADSGPHVLTASRTTAPLAVIWPLLGRHIAFHRRLVDLTASVKAALLLSQSIYWTRHGRDIAENGGWFLKTTQQWELETGLSAKEQATTREVLRRQSMLEEQRLGIPARLHFRLRMDELAARLSDRIAGGHHGQDWSDRVMVAELLGPSLAYHRTLAGITGGVHAGLMLSRALHLTRLQTKRRLDGWICNSAAHWSAEIGLTRREQESARRDLTRTGLWEETLRGIPPSLMARIRLDCLLSLLTDCPAAGDPDPRVVEPVGGRAADGSAPKGETRMRVSHRLVSPKPPNQICRNRHHSVAASAIILIDHSTSDLLQPQNVSDVSEESTLASGGGELIFPDQLLPDERTAAGRLLRDCGDQAQALLDELTGRLHARGVRTSPIAYLRGLIWRAAAGSFVPELGPRIASARRQRHQDIVLSQAHVADQKRLAAEHATPEYQAEIQLHREAITQLIGDLKLRLRGGKRS